MKLSNKLLFTGQRKHQAEKMTRVTSEDKRLTQDSTKINFIGSDGGNETSVNWLKNESACFDLNSEGVVQVERMNPQKKG